MALIELFGLFWRKKVMCVTFYDPIDRMATLPDRRTRTHRFRGDPRAGGRRQQLGPGYA